MQQLLKKMRVAITDRVTRDQAKDSGLAIILILVLVQFFTGDLRLNITILVVLVLVMTAPDLFRPFAVVWFGFSRIMGSVASKVMFSILFVLLVIPVGLIRRLMGKDRLQLKEWKAGTDSVFSTREHKFGPEDIDKPF